MILPHWLCNQLKEKVERWLLTDGHTGYGTQGFWQKNSFNNNFIIQISIDKIAKCRIAICAMVAWTMRTVTRAPRVSTAWTIPNVAGTIGGAKPASSAGVSGAPWRTVSLMWKEGAGEGACAGRKGENPILLKRILFSSSVTLRVHPLDSKVGWTGELWLKTKPRDKKKSPKKKI